MEAVMDSVGRLVVPKALRDSLGLTPGARVSITTYGGGLQLVPLTPPPSLLRDEDGNLVLSSTTRITAQTVQALQDELRR